MPVRILSLSLLVTAVVACVVDDAAASNWPRFRGPNGTGVSTDKDVPVELTEKVTSWKIALPGAGNSSPIVWNGRIFLQAAAADGKGRQLVCVDLNDGKILWQKSSPGTKAVIHKWNTFASCTAATDGTRVYMPFWDGANLSVSAFDFDGKVLWTKELGSFTSQHGAGHSPLLVAGKVILANDQDGSSVLVALDAATGKVAWQTTRQAHRACYSTPLLLDKPDGSLELLVAGTFGFTGYDPQTGTENWKWSWNDHVLRTVGSPLYHDGMLFVGSGDGKGDRHAVAVKLERAGSTTQTSLVWEEKKSFPYVPTMLTRGEYLFTINDLGVADCYVAKTGENVWRQRLGGSFFASPILVDGKIYACNEAGDVYVYPAEPTFKLLSNTNLGEGVMATPAVADSRLIVRGREHLFCFGKPTAKK